MVQSLVPIWEEEYERSGVQEASKQDDPSKPHPDKVLRSFMHGLDYDKALSELCVGTCKYYPSRIHVIDGDEKLATYIGSKEISSQILMNADLKSLDAEALGLLNWLASSQAEEELDASDELLQEAILTPLLPGRPYSVALEIAHRDYENASQLECQDILDSVENMLKPERSKEHASSSVQDLILDSVEGVLKSEGSKEQASFFSRDFLDEVSSVIVIPQVDGSFDEILDAQKGDTSESSMPFGRKKTSAQSGLTDAKVSYKPKENKLRGTLPFCISESKQETIETSSPVFSGDEMMTNCLKNEIDLENFSEKHKKTVGLCSVRDLMRKKRYLRVEQAEAQVQKNEYMVPNMMEELTPTTSVTHQNVEGDVACSTISSSGFQRTKCLEHQSIVCEIFGVNSGSSANEVSSSKYLMNQEARDVPMHEPESKKLFELSEVKTTKSVCRDERPVTLPGIVKCHSNNHNHNSAENDSLKSHLHKDWNSGYVEKRFVRNPDSGIAHVALLPEMQPRNLQESISEENASEGFFEMTLASRPPSNEDIHDPDVSLPSGRTDWNIDGLEKIIPFFPGVSLDVNLREGNAICSQDLALGIPTHFQNDGSVLYMLTYALSPPTLNTVYDWLPVGKQRCVLDIVASKEGIDSYIDGVLNDGASCCQNSPPPTIVNWSFDELSQWNEENCPSEVENVHRCVSSEIKLDSLPAKEKVITNDFCNLSQISGPEKYQNSILTPLSQIGFRDPAYLGCGQQLTVISMELLAESRGDLRPDPKFDAINALSLVVQEDTSNISQIYVLLRVIDDKPVEKNGNGIFDCKLFHFTEEKPLLEHFVEIISYHDPDILMGWEIQGSSLGYLAERALCLGINLLKKISRTPFLEKKDETKDSRCTEFSYLPEVAAAEVVLDGLVIEDEWGRNHASGLHVGGRIVLNIWRLMRSELKLNIYTVEAVAEDVLRQKIPLFSYRMLNQWYSSDIGRARHKCIEYLIVRSMLNLKIMVQLDTINRTSELARVFGIDFFSVISRGSQYRVESMLLRLAHTQNFLAISPGHQQVASQPAMECLPLVMEPESGFYADPVVVLDFQSLYPSMIIAYNICYSTCLGKAIPSRDNVLGVSSYSPDIQILKDLGEKILLTPNGVMYVPPDVRKGVLPRLLEEILSTRIMVKQTMKNLTSSKLVLQRILNSRQLALKLISNVTYGYTAASFSGRMPCAEIADSIVQCGRRTLETAISFVNQHESWKAKVIYGDTDSMFVLLKGRSKEDAFVIGNEIASAITAMNPQPVALKMEKVYQPCFLLTKKRYVGYSYESPVQEKPMFDAKGIETVRRDTCPAVAKILERSIRLFFESKNLSEVKSYLKRQWTRILSGKISFKDFVFAKEVRLGTYRASSLPPAAIVARKAMEVDPRAEPLYGERVPYVVVHGEPGSRLVDMVIDPFKLLDLNSPYRPNDLYYINKQIIPALQRVFGLIGADLNQWFFAIPRPTKSLLAKRFTHMSHSRSAHEDEHDYPTVSKKPQAKSRIDTYYSSKHCALCGELIQSSDCFCVKCSKKESLLVATVVGRTSEKERQMQHLAEICRHCGGGDWVLECGVKCISLACSVFYERRKVQKELGVLSSFAAQTGFYPPCDAELF